MPGGTLRSRALEEISKVKWDPAWGEGRISNMIATRPDWCISRQRIWGVPIAVFLCGKCGKPLLDPALNRKVVELFARAGADAWYTPEADALVPPGTKCAHCQGTTFKKEMDILDVWFESGSSYLALRASEPEYPADFESLSRRRRPASRMVPFFPALHGRHAESCALQARRDRGLDAR